MKNIKTFLFVLAAALCFSACGPQNHYSNNRRHHKKKSSAVAVQHHKVAHLKDGRYAYNDNGIWYFYMYMSIANNNTISYYNTPNSMSSLPSGGSWVQMTDSITDNLVDNVSAIQDVLVEVNVSGQPISVTEAYSESIGETMSLSDYNASEGSDHGQAMSDGDHMNSDTSSMDSSSSVDTSSADTSSAGGDAGGGGDPE